MLLLSFPSGTVVKNPPADTGDVRDTGLIPGSGRSPGEEMATLQYSCLGKPMGRGAWQVTVHGVAKSQTTEGLSVHARNASCYLFILSSEKKRWPKLFLSISYTFGGGADKKRRRNFQGKNIIKNMIYFKRISYCNRMKMEVRSYLRLPVHAQSLSCDRIFVIPWTVVHGMLSIFQARVLEQIAISSSRGSS